MRAAALRLGAWAAMTLCCAAALQLDSTISGTAVVVARELADGRHERLLFVRMPDGSMVPVQVADEGQLDGLTTGQPVTAQGRWHQAASGTGPAPASASAGQAAGPPRSFAAAVIVQHATGQALKPQVTGLVNPGGGAGPAFAATSSKLPLVSNPLGTAELTVLIIPIVARDPVTGKACPGTTGLPTVGKAGVEAAVFEGKAPAGSPTLASTFRSCSLGRTKLSPATSLVLDPVELPCSAVINGNSLTWQACEFGNILTWADAADAAVAKKGINISRFKQHVYLLPPLAAPCNFVGLGYVGCDGSMPCRAWIGNGFWTQPAALAHEIAHGLYLQHSGSRLTDGRVDEYADNSCLQGYCCAPRCWNTPHAWQLGWISVLQLDSSSIKAGQTVTARLPSQSVTATGAGLRIVPDWVPKWNDTKAGTAPLFVGFRTNQGGDAQLFDMYASKANVYTSAIANGRDPAGSVLETSLSVNMAWTYAAAKLVVKMKSLEAAAAVVTVCRKGGPETLASCKSGLDNDCNGLAGQVDPACRPILDAYVLQLNPPRKKMRRPANFWRRTSPSGLTAAPPLQRRRFMTTG